MTDQRNGSAEWHPPWQAKSLWLAAGITLLGLVLWVATPDASPPPSAPEGGTPLAQASGEAVATSVHSAQGTPALFRFGLSYIAGFFLGYGIKRFLMLTLILSAALAAVVFVLKSTGWLNLDWAAFEEQARASLGWLTGQTEALRAFLSGYVPSAVAAAVGIFMGMRWR